MNRYINCIAHQSSEGQLLIGSEFTALFDCGMMFCCEKTIQNVKNALISAGKQSDRERNLDYIFLTHTHYDHIGALPFFRKEWNNVRIVTSEIGAAILLKDTPRKVIRELSAAAAKSYNINLDMDYNDDLFHADITVKDNEIISLGGTTAQDTISVQTIFTPGHTRDSLAFFIPELKILIINETPGILMPDGIIYPCYLTSYNDTINSIKRCTQIPYEHISMPHCGIVDSKKADGFFEKALEINTACRDFILDMKNKNYTEDEMLNSYFTQYGTETLLSYQPKEAFIANAKATISSTLKESM